MLATSKLDLKPGDPAPEFTLVDQDGRITTLAGFRGSNLVLFFYPKDDSPGCTREACGFRDHYQIFRDAGAEVIGISDDSVESHLRFARKHHLPFRLLADPEGTVRRAYGVHKSFGLLPGRVTFVIDRHGIVRHAFSSQLRLFKHITESLQVFEDLASESGPSNADLPDDERLRRLAAPVE